jgi:catecholate siderophore receptor
MKKITRKHGVALLAIALANFNLSAQDGGGATSELNPLNVIGSQADAPTLSSGLKSSGLVKDIPKSISIVTDDQIKAQGLKSVGDIIDYTPGVNNSQGEGHRDAAVIRGMRTTQDFYRDGIRDDVQYYRPLYNIEQVEIIRGPDALLSGFGGAYGIINRVSKKGMIGEDFTTLSGSIDTFGETNVQLDKNMQLNENTAFRVNIFGENLENHRDFYYGDGFGVNPVLKYDLGDGSTLDLSYEYLTQERFIDRGIPTDDGSGNFITPMKKYKDIVFGDSTDNFSTHDAHIFRAIFEHELSDILKGRLSASHSSHDKLYQNLYANDMPSLGVVELNGYIDTTQRSTGILSYEVSGELETGSIVHNLIAGVEYQDIDNDNDRYYSKWDNSGSSKANFIVQRPLGISGGRGLNSATTAIFNEGYAGPNSDLYDRTFAEIDVLSFYLNDEVSLTDSLSLILGVRFDDMNFDVNGLAYDKDNGGTGIGKDSKVVDVTNNDSDSTTSPRVGLTFDLTNEAMLYAAYSESFAPKAGDQYAKLGTNDSKFDPNSFENIEFGVRYDLPTGLSFNAAYFEIQANKPVSDGGTGSVIEESETTGFEIGLTGSLTDRWFLTAGYTDLDARDKHGHRLREAPESTFSMWNNYLISDRLAVNLGIIYQDESLIKSAKNATTTYPEKLPDYFRIDVGASYGLTDNTTLGLNIENLTDELYFPHSHSTHQASVGAPINAMLSITSSF